MLELVIDNSYSQLKGMTPEQFSQVRKLLSYEPDPSAAFFGGFKGSQRRYLIDRKGFFPTGLISYLGEVEIAKITDIRNIQNTQMISSIKGNFGNFVQYKAQSDVVNIVRSTMRGTISMPTGTGKSMVMALIINTLKLRTLIVVPNLSIRNQLREVLRGIFGNTPHVVIENIDSTNLKSHINFDMLIIDEAHHVGAKTYHNLNKLAWKGISHRYFLTATPFRNIEAEQILFKAIAGDIIYSLSYTDAIKNKYIVPVEASYLTLPKQMCSAVTYAQVYSQMIVNNDYRNQVISALLQDLIESNKFALCLVKEIKHGQILSEATGIPFVCGEDAESKAFIAQFNSGEIKQLIGTTGVIGEGVDTKPCEYVIIAGLGKAKSSFMQQVGRSVRRFDDKESGKIVLFRDTSHKFLLRHFNAQVAILKDEYSIKAIKLN